MKKILVIDDNADLRLLLKNLLTSHGYIALVAASGSEGLRIAKTDLPDLIVCDFKLHDMDGREVLLEVREMSPSIPLIIITGYSDMRTAIEVMRLGAIDYIIKPLVADEILLCVRTITEASSGRDVQVHRQNAGEPVDPSYIFSDNPDINKILKQIDLVAPTNMSVIIFGESGSGKEAFAKEIHKRSDRKDKPFHAVDCGTLSKELAASALFGHERGAFTGAIAQTTGVFEAAKGGTVFLDEISNLDYTIQVYLLRVIEERTMRRVGGIKDIHIDVRILVASNKQLWNKSDKNSFRKDLYHRFNEFIIEVPPLRERKDDILFFAAHFLRKANEVLNKNVKGFDPQAENILLNYPWPGNLRELNNIVRRATLLADNDYILTKCLPIELMNGVDRKLVVHE